MANGTRLRLIQFKAAYNLPVHVGREKGIFARHGLEIVFTYTPGSLYLAEAVRKREFDIGHTGADDVIADVEDYGGAPDGLFLFMGLHSGLLSLVGAPGMNTIESLRGKRLAVDARASGFVFILEKLLRSRGFNASEYDFVEVGGWEKRYEALLEGEVQRDVADAALYRKCTGKRVSLAGARGSNRSLLSSNRRRGTSFMGGAA
jgi:ABC-type nitrate/sulfonate/bicarbonate transport system substrate-binding protein